MCCAPSSSRTPSPVAVAATPSPGLVALAGDKLDIANRELLIKLANQTIKRVEEPPQALASVLMLRDSYVAVATVLRESHSHQPGHVLNERRGAIVCRIVDDRAEAPSREATIPSDRMIAREES